MYEVLQDYSVQLILLLRAFVKQRASIEKECSQVPLQVHVCERVCVCVCVCCVCVCVCACARVSDNIQCTCIHVKV